MTVTLTLSAEVNSTDTVTVTYAVPGMNPVQDESGNDVAALTTQSVTNNTPAPPLPPTTLISNTGSSTAGVEGFSGSVSFAQSFRTGGNPGGYTLHSVVGGFSALDSGTVATLTAEVTTNTPLNNPRPGSLGLVAALIVPSTSGFWWRY